MLTRCPHCQTWFKVRAAQLSAAGGRVTCGRCERVFDALANLIEDAPPPELTEDVEPPPHAGTGHAVPASSPEPADPAAATDRAAADPTAALREEAAPVASEVESAAPAPAPIAPSAGAPPAPLAHAPEAGVARAPDAATDARAMATCAEFELPPHALSADEHAILFTEPGASPPADEDVEDDTVPEARKAAAPAVLAAELAALSAPGLATPMRSPAWTVTAVLLACALATQGAWIARVPITSHVPGSAELLAWVCARVSCPERAPNASPIRLLARDVREHPQYHDALLVNATLVNEASRPQPYPVIELRLHDATGNVLGARAFRPDEYLDQSIAAADGMPPGRPVYVVMELGRTAAGAVSFEFVFL